MMKTFIWVCGSIMFAAAIVCLGLGIEGLYWYGVGHG
jgi:hypothetical protein